MAIPTRVLIFNPGSSSLKWSVLEVKSGVTIYEQTEPWASLTAQISAELAKVGTFEAVGHRITHGGVLFRAAVCLNENVRAKLETLVPLDAIHLQPQLAAIYCITNATPALPQVLAFDTAFHATMPPAAA